MPAQPTDFLSRLEPLYTAVLCDVLDALGFRNQAISSQIRPLTSSQKICGRVFTARAEAVDSIPAEPYKLEIAAVEALQRGDVLVIDAQNHERCGLWGELLTTACQVKGVRGVVMSACSRDLWKLQQLKFPIFGLGCHPADSKGRADIVALGEPITLGGVHTKPGDLLLGDEDGLVIIPIEIAAEALRLATEKVAGENVVRAELARGVPMGEVFKKHGVL